MKRHEMTFAGTEIRFREPTALALTHARMAMRAKQTNLKAARALKFLEVCLDEDSHEAIRDRVYDHEDPFDIDELVELMGVVADPTLIGNTPSTGGPTDG